MKLAFLFFNIFLLENKKTCYYWRTARKERREQEAKVLYWAVLSNTRNSYGLARLHLEARKSTCSPAHKGGRRPSTWSISWCFPQHISRKWDQKQSSRQMHRNIWHVVPQSQPHEQHFKTVTEYLVFCLSANWHLSSILTKPLLHLPAI